MIFSYIEGCLLVLIFNTCLIVFMNYKKFMGIIGFSPRVINLVIFSAK